MIRDGRVPWCALASFAIASSFIPVDLSLSEAQMTLDRRQPSLMSSYKWASLSERQRGIYVRGFLETTSYLMYGHSQQNNEEEAQMFSDWTLCAERQSLSRWQTRDWGMGELERTAAAQFYDVAPSVCKDFARKGNKTWRAVWLLKLAEWKSLSLRDRAIYLMAYVETLFAGLERAKGTEKQREGTEKQRELDICIASAGIEGLVSSMEQTRIEAQYPLPWSVARALGTTCRRAREGT